MDEFKRFDVVVDYVTTATVTVSAHNEEEAEEVVESYLQTEKGQEDMLRRMNVNRNVPDGFEIALVEEARPNVPHLYWSDHERGEY